MAYMDTSQTVLERRQKIFMPAMGHFYGSEPLELVRGKGTHVWDQEGNEYLDLFCGVAVTSLGHCHPEVVEAAAIQLGTLQHTTSLYLSELVTDLGEAILSVAPPNLSRLFFCADGSGAIDGAMIAARRATGRREFLSFDQSLHGRTALTMGATGIPMWKNDPSPDTCFHHVTAPISQSLEEAIESIEKKILQVGPGKIAAFIAEPVMGNGGIIVPPDGFFQALKSLLDSHGILLVIDEVQTGFCRTGKWFGINHWAVEPDLICVAKAMTNGLPQAAWLCTEAVASSMTKPIASTFGGNLVTMAAGIKVLEIMQRDNLADKAQRDGNYLRENLKAITGATSFLSNPRGLGLMIGIPVLSSDNSSAELTDRILNSLRRKGILIGKTGIDRNVLTLLPPLTITPQEMDLFLHAMEETIREIL